MSLFSKSNRSAMQGNRVITLESLEHRTVLTALLVTSGDDAGAGTLRDAVEQANADPSINTIKISKFVDSIQLDESIEFTGEQNLSIRGRNNIVEPAAGQEGVFDLLISSGGADLSISKLTFQNGQQGIHVPVPEDATGTIKLTLNKVTVTGSALHGVLFDDQGEDESGEPNSEGSDATIYFKATHSTFTGNGVGDLDYDGVRVQEGGLGDIVASVSHTQIDANGGDGLELDERGEGDVKMTVVKSTFNDNGFFNEADLDDGLDIDEADGGSIIAKVINSDLSNNFDEGLDLDEAGAGDAIVSVIKTTANNNNDEGIKIDEEDEGSVAISLFSVEANGSKEQEGIAVEELGEGDFYASLIRVSANDNAKDGIDFAEEDNGSMNVSLIAVRANNNADNGIKLEEAGEGDFSALAVFVQASENAEYGIEAVQETVADDEGSLNLVFSDLADNLAGDLELDGVLLS